MGLARFVRLPHSSTVRGMKVLGVILVFGSAGILGFHYLGELYAIDMCLDSGYVYDYATSQCREDAIHLPVISYTERHIWLISVTAISFLIGVILLTRSATR